MCASAPTAAARGFASRGGPARVVSPPSRFPPTAIRPGLFSSFATCGGAGAGPRRRVPALVVASRGLWTPAGRQALAHRLRGLARRVHVVSDAQAALLGALGRQPGMLILSGTGSIVVGWNARGRWARAGGLGPFVGDEGSGFWLGREWLRATARDGLPAALRIVHTPDPVRAIAALAPIVLARARRGDRRAQRIVAESQRLLAAGAREVVRALKLRHPVNASWAGSVLENRRFRAGLIRAVARAGIRAHWHR